jgi:hypothetical protein
MNIQPSTPSGRKVGFAVGFLSAVFLFVALFVVQAYNATQSIASQRATGLAVAGGFDNPLALWSGTSLTNVLFQTTFSRGGISAQRGEPEDQSRKIVKSGSLQIEAANPATAADQIQRITKLLGGEIFSSTLNNPLSDKAAISLVIHVPAGSLDQAREEIKSLDVHLDSEHIEVRDVGKEYVDLDATLRNEEQTELQYLGILKKATTVHDTLEISQHLSEVRGDIEKTKGEFRYLTRQIEMSSLEIVILSENQLGPLNLRPLYRMKMAWQNVASSIADFVAAFVMVLSYLPAAFLWMVSLFLLGAFAWRIVRWLWKVLIFKPNKQIAV